MQIGSLVKWKDAYGNPEYGVVVSLTALSEEDRVLVYFPEDNGNSFICIDDLELVCE